MAVGTRRPIVGTWLLPLLQHQLASRLTYSLRSVRTLMSARRVHRDSFNVVERLELRCSIHCRYHEERLAHTCGWYLVVAFPTAPTSVRSHFPFCLHISISQHLLVAECEVPSSGVYLSDILYALLICRLEGAGIWQIRRHI